MLKPDHRHGRVPPPHPGVALGWYRTRARRQGHPGGRGGAVSVLQRRGLPDREAPDPLAREQPLLAALTAASIQGRVATGPRAGQRRRRRLSDPAEGHRTGPLCCAARGFSLHAATRVRAADRERLEHLCRYLLRPPLAAARLRWVNPQTLAFSLKTPWDDGTTDLVVSPHELLERLAALVPPPRRHLIRYHGVLAPHAADRARIVPVATARVHDPPASSRAPGRLAWAQLLARVFRVDLKCPACGGPLQIIAALTDPDSIRTYLNGVGLDCRPPPIAPARLAPQPEFDFAA